MFSLNDEITKFESLALTLKDDTMAIQEKFLGGGIRMKDLIQENSFIMAEMRKMKEVFLNYCKLNDKIYKKIIEHEMSAKDHERKLGSILPTVDRKLEDFTIEVSKLKEITVVEIHKNKQLIEGLMDNVKNNIETRVHQDGFDMRIKKLFDIYKVEDQSEEQETLLDENGNPILFNNRNSKSKKRKGGYSLQQIQYIAKLQFTPAVAQINEKIAVQQSKLAQLNRQISPLYARMKKMEQYSCWLGDDLAECKKILAQNKKEAKISDQKIIDLINERINEDVWSKKFYEFDNRYVKVHIEDSYNELNQLIETVKKEVIKLQPRFTRIDKNFQAHTSKQQILQTKIQQNKLKVDENHGHAITMNKRVQGSIEQTLKFCKSVESSLEKQLKRVQKEYKSSVGSLSDQISKIIDSTMKSVYQRIEVDLGKETRQTKKSITSLKEKEIDLRDKVKNLFTVLDHMKDIVASKANFSDLVINFDRKADRHQVQELQEVMKAEPPQNITLTTKKNEKQDKYQRSKSAKSRRRLNGSYSRISGNLESKNRNDEENKRFPSMDWEGLDFSQQLRTIQPASNRIRHKSVRTSTAGNTHFLF